MNYFVKPEKKNMTLDEIVQFCANSFIKELDEEGLETFEELKKKYWLDSKDIKEEYLYYYFEDSNSGWFIDVWGDIQNHLGDEIIKYRKFINMVYALLKKAKRYSVVDYSEDEDDEGEK